MADEPEVQAGTQVTEPDPPKHSLYPAADPKHEGMLLLDAAKQQLATLVGTVVENAPQSVVELHKLHLDLATKVANLAKTVDKIVSAIQTSRAALKQ